MFYFLVREDIIRHGNREKLSYKDFPIFKIDGYDGLLFEAEHLEKILNFFGIRKLGESKTHISEIRRVFVAHKDAVIEDNEIAKLSYLVKTATFHFSRTLTIEEFFDEKKIFFDSIKDSLKKKIFDFSSYEIEKYKNSFPKKIASFDSDIKSLEFTLKKKRRDFNDLEKKILRAESLGGVKYYEDEYNSLLKLEKVKSVKVQGNKLMVFTDTLYAKDPRSKKTHLIGKFRIEIPMNGDGIVRWFNLTQRIDASRDGMNAPHVYSDGHACLGNTKETFGELIENYEFFAATLMAIAFIESVNVDDIAGDKIDRWPVAYL